MKNAVAERGKAVPFSVKANSKAFQTSINNALQDPKRAMRFTSAITSAVTNLPALQECDAGTILTAGLLGESLNLSPSPQLGQYYMVPFNDRRNKRKVATFVLGYKGMIQLAIRSGQYRTLGVSEVKEGELASYNPITEEVKLDPCMDPVKRESLKTIGYYAWFELVNGFKKELYWTKDKMEIHAVTYSAGYKAKKGYTFWEKDFDGMAKKTMLRQLISKWGVMSIELQTAYENDQAVVNQDGEIFTAEAHPDYVGYDTSEVVDVEVEPVQEATEPSEVNLNAL